MRELRIIAWDDLAMADGHRRVEATEVRRLAVGAGSRRHEVQLDLTLENAEAFDKIMGTYLHAGHKPEPDAQTQAQARQATGRHGRQPTVSANWREYAALIGYNTLTNQQGKPYKTGKPYYPPWLKRETAEWVAAGRPQDWTRPAASVAAQEGGPA